MSLSHLRQRALIRDFVCCNLSHFVAGPLCAFCLAVLFKQFVVVTGLFGLPEEISVKIWKTVSN